MLSTDLPPSSLSNTPPAESRFAAGWLSSHRVCSILGVLSTDRSSWTGEIGSSPPYPVAGFLPLRAGLHRVLLRRWHGLRLYLNGRKVTRRRPRCVCLRACGAGIDIGVAKKADLTPVGLGGIYLTGLEMCLDQGNINVNQFSEFHERSWHPHDTGLPNFLLEICLNEPSNFITHNVL